MTPKKYKALLEAVRFAHDMALEELPHAQVGTGAEVVLRHIARKTTEAIAAAYETPTYTVGVDARSITCHVCGHTSSNAGDVMHLYCGHCHQFHLKNDHGGREQHPKPKPEQGAEQEGS